MISDGRVNQQLTRSQRLEDHFSHGKIREGSYNGFEILSFRGWQYLQDQSDVFNILREFPHLSAKLDKLLHMCHPDNRSERFWGRVFDVLGMTRGFWDNVKSDLPWQLDEGIRSRFSKIELVEGSLAQEIGQQMLSRHPIYSNAVLVRDYFRCFPRDDGCQKIH